MRQPLAHRLPVPLLAEIEAAVLVAQLAVLVAQLAALVGTAVHMKVQLMEVAAGYPDETHNSLQCAGHEGWTEVTPAL